MKRNVPSHSHREEKPRSSRSEDYEMGLRSRTEEERLRRRREWIIQQERVREHEKLKRKKILEYEIRRAREQGLPLPSRRSSRQCRSKSKSSSPECRHGRPTSSNRPKTSILSEKLEPSDGTTPLFKGPEGTQVSATELRRIKVDIHRNIPGKTTIGELQRDIINPEDVVVKRRTGEGSKPIFEREDIKGAACKTEEIEEHRTVVAVKNDSLETKSKVSKKYASTSSFVRSRSHSPRRTSPHHSRYEDSKHENREGYRSDRERDRSRGRSREYKEKDRHRGQSHEVRESHPRERKSHQDHSRSREREHRRRDRDSYHRDERSYREYRGRSRERSRDRREREISREHRVPQPHYVEQIPVPIYYGNFPPRPIMVGPLVPIRGQVPLGGRHPSIVGPLRPFHPRFMPPDMYRLRPPLNPRFRPMH